MPMRMGAFWRGVKNGSWVDGLRWGVGVMKDLDGLEPVWVVVLSLERRYRGLTTVGERWAWMGGWSWWACGGVVLKNDTWGEMRWDDEARDRAHETDGRWGRWTMERYVCWRRRVDGTMDGHDDSGDVDIHTP
jgi:hypothetical protein